MMLRHLPALLREPGREHPSDDLPALVEALIAALDRAGHKQLVDEPYHVADVDYLTSIAEKHGDELSLGDKFERRAARRLTDVLDEYLDGDTPAQALE